MLIFIDMINQHPMHILNQMGVISSFSIAKKVTENYIDRFFVKYKKDGKNKSEIENLLKEKIGEEIQNAIINQQIPGLLGMEEIAKEMGIDENIIKNIVELNRIVMVVSHKLLEKKYDKMSLCYFVNSLVNFLGLSEVDFEKFHRNNNRGEDEDGEEYKNA